MRHILDFLHFGKRNVRKTERSSAQRSENLDPASTLIIAGEPIPCDDNSATKPVIPDGSIESKKSSGRLADVVKAKRKDRWQPPHSDGPEFGGLIERRGVDTRGLMPAKYEPKIDADNRHHELSVASGKSAHAAVSESLDEQGLESTGMFLAALDNSAITLADSGLFRITDEPEEAAEPKQSFNPYDHKASTD
jgi:hypothetical protein